MTATNPHSPNTAYRWEMPLDLSQWAQTYRRLSPESSAAPGKWSHTTAPYQKEMMDALQAPDIHTLVLMTSAQVGKTEVLNNILGYFIHQDPGPILIVQPTVDMAEAYSKDRLAPMLRDTPCLRELIHPPKSRDSGNTVLHKQFKGGHLTIAGANSPASLASRPIRLVLCDEVDRYPVSAGTEGDPILLAHKRTTTFWKRKLILTSTPTQKGHSRIEKAFEQSDQRHFEVPCPHCHHFQALTWKQLHWPKDNPQDAHYQCVHCHQTLHHAQKSTMIAQGEWRSSKNSDGIAGFHINELYSPWVSWGQMAQSYLKSNPHPEQYQVWVNTALGEPYEIKHDTLSPEALLKRCEDYGPELPQPTQLLTMGIDVQGDRLECETVAWGPGEESWSMHYDVIHGNPAEESLWVHLLEILSRAYKHPSGAYLQPRGACIDSGGHHTQLVYRFCQRFSDRIVPIKGASQHNQPLVKPAQQPYPGLNLYLIGTDTAKSLLYSRLAIQTPGPGFCHFPKPDKIEGYRADLNYFRQLTSEHAVTKHINGQDLTVYEKSPHTRNEALDCRVYAMAAYHLLNPTLQPLTQLQGVTTPPNTTQPNKRKTSWEEWQDEIRAEHAWRNAGNRGKFPKQDPWLRWLNEGIRPDEDNPHFWDNFNQSWDR